MIRIRLAAVITIAAFLLGFGLGGVSLRYAQAQGLFGLSTSVQQIGHALVEMQQNVDDLQKNMGTIKQAKDQLSNLVPRKGESVPRDGDSFKKMLPGLGQ